MNNDDLVRAWFAKASSDLRSAEIIIASDAKDLPSDAVCFHCQQAAEKYLKGFLTSREEGISPYPQPEGCHVLPVPHRHGTLHCLHGPAPPCPEMVPLIPAGPCHRCYDHFRCLRRACFPDPHVFIIVSIRGENNHVHQLHMIQKRQLRIYWIF